MRPDGSIEIGSGTHATVDGVTVLVAGRPRWSDETAVLTAQGAALSIAEAYRSRGKELLATLHGSFALAVADSRQRRGLLAIDRVGICQLHHARLADGTLIFATGLRELVEASDQNVTLNLQAIFDFTFLHMIPAPATVYAGVYKLRAAHMLDFDGSKSACRRYWAPTFARTTPTSESELAWQLKSTLRQAVQTCAPAPGAGSFLSGGIDSSSVTGTLCGLRPHSPSFSIGFESAGFDEMNYARIAARHFQSEAHEYYVTAADIVTAIPLIADAYDEPFANSSAVPTYFCARLAREHGVERLLAGDGGDELFGGNERYVKQKIFEAYWHVAAGLRRMLIDPVSLHLPQSIWPLRKLRSYVEQARVPMPRRLYTWNFLYRNPAESVFEPEFLAAIDREHTLRGLDELYGSAPTQDLVDRMLYFDWQITLADNDLKKVNRMCRIAGVEVLYPMLDDRVVELSTRLPPDWKVRGNTLRWFYKRAMSDVLPATIIGKTKHGFGLPFGQWLKESHDLQDTVYSSVSLLERQKLVRRDFLEALIRDHKTGHSGFYGYMIWVLVTLGHWLESRSLRV